MDGIILIFVTHRTIVGFSTYSVAGAVLNALHLSMKYSKDP
jgi:hypothetical protein